MTIGMRTDQAGVLWLTGDLDFTAFDDLLSQVSPMLDGKHELVLDVSEVTFLDSTGMRALLILAGKSQGVLVIRRPTPSVRRALDIAGIAGPGSIRIEE
jgi:anti-anti-sigma factor